MERPGEAFLRKSGSRNPVDRPWIARLMLDLLVRLRHPGYSRANEPHTKPALIQVIAASRIAVIGALELV